MNEGVLPIMWALWIGAIPVSYLLGCINPSIMTAKAKGVDIRKEGSGNPGTTNTLRVLGKKYAALVLLVDILKGVLAVLLGKFVGLELLGLWTFGELLPYACGLAAFCGHVWPAFYGFRGGKGVATGFGVLAAIHPIMGFSCLAVAILVVLVSRRVSVATLSAAASAPVFTWLWEPDFFLWCLALVIIVFVKHRANLRRLMAGTEPKLSFKK
ncbi:MAG: glycerol-3-phosphate 1-O-acyltransferase PlsY [Bacillota bacterium]|nr:glycerol-3-phosphate 1-O-acyltransferase PlsY [Bacillota bacterium]